MTVADGRALPRTVIVATVANPSSGAAGGAPPVQLEVPRADAFVPVPSPRVLDAAPGRALVSGHGESGDDRIGHGLGRALGHDADVGTVDDLGHASGRRAHDGRARREGLAEGQAEALSAGRWGRPAGGRARGGEWSRGPGPKEARAGHPRRPGLA